MLRSFEGMERKLQNPGGKGGKGGTHHERRVIILWSWGNGGDTMLDDDTLGRLEAFS